MLNSNCFSFDVYRINFEKKDNIINLEINNVISWDSVNIKMTRQELVNLSDFIDKFLENSKNALQ